MAVKTVFSPLRNLPRPLLTEAVYLLLLVLRQRSFFDREDIKAMLDAAAVGSSTDPDGTSRKAVDATVQAIESAEGRSLSEIPESEIGDYRQMLSDLLSENVQANLVNSNISGAELLHQLGT